MGGISKTVNFNGYLFDLGGHRFFSKSGKVNALWKDTLGEDFLERPRLSRIYYKNKFFNYPINIFNALKNLGFLTSFSIALSYLAARLSPYEKEETFEQWVSNKFGKKLYRIFFKNYTEKLWGIPCHEIESEWASQRIRGLSLFSAVKNAIFPKKNTSIKTLIDKFKYPRFGPGMMYEKMARNIENSGGKFLLNSSVCQLDHRGGKVIGIWMENPQKGKDFFTADHFISSIPITMLARCLSPAVPEEVLAASRKLRYRSLVTVNLIFSEIKNFPDNWLYVHSPEVKMLRIQNYKNWSPFMVPEDGKYSLGLEYYCNEKDEFWNTTDKDLISFGILELEKIGISEEMFFQDGFVIRVPDAYPVYDRKYRENIEIIRKCIDGFSNLQPVGRYGMFKYNNMDHSILTGLYAAENILGEKHNIWEVNCDRDYHEENIG